jgi:uncharacterized membrane protein
MSTLSVAAYWPLWLLALLPLAWWASLRSRTNLSRGHLALATVLRTLALAFLVLALMQPTRTTRITEVSVVYALDVSRSVASGFVQSALDFAKRANMQAAPSVARYVVFADRARLVDSPDEVAKVGVSTAAADRDRLLYQGATNLELALDQALLGLDPSRVQRVVLFTDGNQTRGDVWRAVPRLAAHGVRVFTFPAPPQAQSDAWIEALDVPEGVRRDEPVSLTVHVVSQRETPAQIAVSADGRPLGARRVRLNPGANAVVIATRIARSGSVTIGAAVRADGDLLADNDRLQQSVWVGPRPRVLYVEGQPDAAQYLSAALGREGLEVQAVGPEGLSSGLSALERFDAVILSDVGPDKIDAARMQALQRYVRESGGGLIFAAGDSTYGKDGFADSALERVLPVEFKSREKRKDLALVLCLDRSYSMKGRPLALAKAGARATLDLLEEQHYFGVVAFDSQPHEAVPLQYVRSKRRAEELLDRIQASGQTNIYPALATAWRMLQNHPAKRKHVILISDGDTAPADFDRLLKRVTDSKITVSTVTIGRSGDPALMERIAGLGGGRAYVAENLEQLPQLFVQDTRNVSRATLMEEPFRPVVKRRIDALRGLDFAKAPPLQGFASTKAKDDAEVFLTADSDSPLLVRWQYGLGRAVVFASDVKNRWAAEWLQWEGYGKFWAQLTRDTLRRETSEQVLFRVAREGDEARVRLRLMTEQGAWRNGLAPRVRATGPDGSRRDLILRQTGPGHYDASMAVATAGSRPYTFAVASGGGVGVETAHRAGTRQLFYPYPDEYHSLPPDLELLTALSEQTGGKVGASVAEIFAAQGDRGQSRTPLWPWLAAIALALYLADICVRRAPWVRRWLE